MNFNNIVLRYRIGIINDFKATTTVVDYQKWGIMTQLDAFEVGGQHRGYQESADGIWIFLNFERVAMVKSKTEAVSILNKLVQNCPREFLSDLEKEKEILFKHVR